MGTFIQNEILAMHWLNRLVASLLTMLGKLQSCFAYSFS